MSDKARTVQVGERTYTVQPFKGFKATRIGRIVAEVTRQVPGVLDDMAQFTREFESKNAVRITRQMSMLPRFKSLFEDMSMTDEDWERCGGAVEIPQPPDPNMVFASVFPRVFEQAEKQVLDLLAWVAVSNADLRDADDSDTVDELIAKTRKDLLHEGDLSELLELFIVGVDMIKGEFAGKRDALTGAISGLTGRQDASSQSTNEQDDEAPVSATSTEKQSLSTDSQPPTDGHDVTPSTESPSAS